MLLHNDLLRMYREDFNEKQLDARGMSKEDSRAYNVMKDTTTMQDGHYKLSLPWRNEEETLPNNRALAMSRLKLLKRKLQRDEELLSMYKDQVNNYITQGYAEKLNTNDVNGSKKIWYLPHHPVVNPNKPGKVRVVFDCAAKFQGVSLNDKLMQGPDLVNSLVGVLTRFRQEPIVLVADIEAMFHQVKVRDSDCDALRFLWWTEGNLNEEPDEYRMKVHIFGATSSPSCTAYALKRTASDNKKAFSSEAVSTVKHNFYVDDLLKSVGSVSQAVTLAAELRELLKHGGFRLTKWISNSKEVLQTIPTSEQAPCIANMSLGDNLPTDRALGVGWNVEQDALVFRIKEKEKPLTRRGILSVVSSLFDPLGLVAPVTLKAKLVLQKLCKDNAAWDDEIQNEDACVWKEWLSSLTCLSSLLIPRCFKPKGFIDVVDTQLHMFSDASEYGYGACGYLRLTDANNKVSTVLVMGKSRVTPIKTTTIPRLELQAAVVSCRLHDMIIRELEIRIDRSIF